MIHPIIILPAVNGFTAQVGCKTFVFTSIKDLTNELAFYLKRPEEVEKFYRENAVNKYLMVSVTGLTNPVPPADPQPVSRSHVCSGVNQYCEPGVTAWQ